MTQRPGLLSSVGCGSRWTTTLAMSFGRYYRQTDMESINLADLYGLPLIDWLDIERRLAQGVSQAPGTGGPDRHTCWLATINRGGSPHVTGVGAVWFDGAFWFETGEKTLKGRSLARDPRCSLSLATHEFDPLSREWPKRSRIGRRLPPWRSSGARRGGPLGSISLVWRLLLTTAPLPQGHLPGGSTGLQQRKGQHWRRYGLSTRPTTEQRSVGGP